MIVWEPKLSRTIINYHFHGQTVWRNSHDICWLRHRMAWASSASHCRVKMSTTNVAELRNIDFPHRNEQQLVLFLLICWRIERNMKLEILISWGKTAVLNTIMQVVKRWKLSSCFIMFVCFKVRVKPDTTVNAWFNFTCYHHSGFGVLCETKRNEMVLRKMVLCETVITKWYFAKWLTVRSIAKQRRNREPSRGKEKKSL